MNSRPDPLPRGVPKRHAYEPPASLLRRPGFDPHMKRPISTLAGGLLVILSALAGALFITDVSLHWFTDTADEVVWMLGDSVTPDARWIGLYVFLGIGGFFVLGELFLAVLVIRGSNWPRVTVMTYSTITICVAFAGWWAGGQDVTFETSLLSVATDVLILLALSSRDAAAYARRYEVVADESDESGANLRVGQRESQ
ncbi:hypothetical protein [Microbacterium xanthum]|uniref:hypothetical protein n=1 Tax=Microbacterium xanthum TaxID=3079794 RepID=UPI002AD56AE0|nr:hypothetical protein [Microbacterium sp. KSW-48]MDZ8172884.1 hypothetical protein [Microbacterium sp. KSW-48]